jgi:hypothetical protein
VTEVFPVSIVSSVSIQLEEVPTLSMGTLSQTGMWEILSHTGPWENFPTQVPGKDFPTDVRRNCILSIILRLAVRHV